MYRIDFRGFKNHMKDASGLLQMLGGVVRGVARGVLGGVVRGCYRCC